MKCSNCDEEIVGMYFTRPLRKGRLCENCRNRELEMELGV